MTSGPDGAGLERSMEPHPSLRIVQLIPDEHLVNRALRPEILASARAAGPSWVREHRSVEKMALEYLTLYRHAREPT